MYSTLDNIKSALNLAWKHKILWILALGLTAGSALSFNNSLNNLSQSTDKSQEQSQEWNSSESQDFLKDFEDDVLGTWNEANSDVTSEQMAVQIEKQLPLAAPLFIISGIFILFLLAAGILLGLLKASWYETALIKGTFEAIENPEKNLDLYTLGQAGLKNMISATKLKIFAGLTLLFLIVSSMIIFVGMPVLLDLPVLFLISFPVLVVGFVLVLGISISLAYAIRLIVSQNATFSKAFFEGFKMLRQNSSNTLKLILFLVVIGFAFTTIAAATGVVFAIPALVAILSDIDTGFKVVLLFISVPLVIAYFTAFGIINNGFLGVVGQFAWTNLFKFITSEEKNQNSPLLPNLTPQEAQTQ